MTKPILHPLALLIVPLLLLPRGPARAIEDGIEAEPCAFPEVVRMFAGHGPVGVLDGPTPINCTGVYIGGHTVLTAAACIDASPAPYEVHWGEAFPSDPTSASQRLRMAIPLDDCRVHPALPIAACTLREMPTMQAIPLLAPCEVDEVLVPGAELFAVGVHQGKTWASAELPEAISNDAFEFELPDTIWTTASELSSQILQPDDRGGPLYARAPDGSLRLAGIALAAEPGRWLASWRLIDWLLEFEDPEVVLPCHSPAGGWAPSLACTQSISDRSLGEGAWGRGPAVCSTTHTITPTPTCQ
jgi:hypothetical protein